MNQPERIHSLDAMRGMAIMLIIVMHAAIYNFANIHLLDFSNPPLTVVLMSFMGLWGGIFFLYSTLVNTVMTMQRTGSDKGRNVLRYLIITGVIYLALHYLIIFILGRWSIDFEHNQPHLTLTAWFFRNFSFRFPPIRTLFDGSSISTVGLNLIMAGGILFLLFRKGGQERVLRNYFIVTTLIVLLMLLSFVRIDMYPTYSDLANTGRAWPGLVQSFLLEKPYPLIPYLAYGFAGMLLGLILYHRHHGLLWKMVLPLGLVLASYGLWGMMQHESSISRADFFWYYKTHFELGLFLLLFITLRYVFSRISLSNGFWTLVRLFSRVSLTVYLLETTLSEWLRYVAFYVYKDWDQTVNGCLLFGAANLIVWAGIIWLWQRAGFRYSLEYYWTVIFRWVGKNSTKLEHLNP